MVQRNEPYISCTQPLQLATTMDFWRKSRRTSALENVKNLGIREIIEIKHDVLKPIEINKLKLYEHVRKISG